MSRRFVTLDVFTDRPLAGNPLAVVLDAEGLDGAAMQAIAREFNLSETVFLLPPRDPRHRARLRIFTPGRELPFAGHPTVGTAVLLALREAGAERVDALAFGLEEEVGTVSCVVGADPARRTGRARFRIPVLPSFAGEGSDPDAIAGALGIAPGEIGFGRHRPSRHAAGNAFDFVPVRSLEVLARLRPDAAALQEASAGEGHVGVYVYTRDPELPGHGFRARMFAPGSSIVEDPATGSAAANFTGVLMQFEPMGDGTHDCLVRQGYEMGRPSDIALQMTIEGGALRSAEIGGGAVVVSEGTLFA